MPHPVPLPGRGRKRRKLHIAFVTTESPYMDRGVCGIASYLRAIIPALVDADHKVTVLANANEERHFTAEEGRVSVHHFRLPILHWYTAKIPLIRRFAPLPLRELEWSWAFYHRVAAVAARTKIDVIESTEVGSLFLSRIAPVVIRLHGSERIFREQSGLSLSSSVRWNDRLEAYGCKHAAAITAPSQFHAREITSSRGWQTERIRVIPNPISRELFNTALQFRRNGNAERVVLYTGRLAPVKGIETLLEAAKLVRTHDPSVTFVLAGPWQMPKFPEHYGLELNRKSADGIQWVGPQNQNEIIEWYKRAALFVMPSYHESFGISAVEAIAFNLPVVATETGSLAEILGKNGSGLLVPKRDPAALARAINRLMSAPAEDGQNGTQSRNVDRQSHPERVAAETTQVYEAALNNSSRKASSR